MKLECNYVAGTGGIGQGILFLLEGNHTMGRNESRMAKLTDYHDYCKLHIIMHYISVFMKKKIPLYAIGRVGNDAQGKQLKNEMQKTGINVEFVIEDTDFPTMYAVCYQYPNGEGCNISSENSACNEVSKHDIDVFFEKVAPEGRGLILAVPEVPLTTRLYLLDLGRKRNCCNVSAVLSGEVKKFVENGGIENTDILAINEEEAEVFSSLDEAYVQGISNVCEASIKFIQNINPEICVIITRGEKGAYVQWKEKIYESPALDVPVVNTAGAGDCFIGTVISALLKECDLFATKEKNVACSALDLGNIASAKKVGCKDTIDFSMNLESMYTFAQNHGIKFAENLRQFFGDMDVKG